MRMCLFENVRTLVVLVNKFILNVVLAFAFLEFNATHRVLSVPMSRSNAEFHFVTFCYSSSKRTRHSVPDSEEFLPCIFLVM